MNTNAPQANNDAEARFEAVFAREGFTSRAAGLFRDLVYGYYRNHRRDFPWRTTDNPYNILVSEFMLQQTQTDRVVPKYERFIAALPDFFALAEAPLRDVLALWQGLGYNRRAIALKKTGQMVVDEHGGRLPDDVITLKTFPGIGITTASEIAAFAFHRPVVFIETNIRRVFLHFFFRDREGIRDNDILPLVEKALDRSDPRNWYYALMDYGVMLKGAVINPNRRSAHYTRQSRFEGSDRQIRGAILRLLLTGDGVPEAEAVSRFDAEETRVKRILGQLKKEGFVRTVNGKLVIGEG